MEDQNMSEVTRLANEIRSLYYPSRTTPRLTEREREVLHAIAEGHGSKAAGAKLFISKRTVDFHLAAAYHKLGVTNRVQAINVATRQGLIPFVREVG